MVKTFVITIKPGSDYQEEVMTKQLQIMLGAFKMFYEQRHKKNNIEIIEK